MDGMLVDPGGNAQCPALSPLHRKRGKSIPAGTLLFPPCLIWEREFPGASTAPFEGKVTTLGRAGTVASPSQDKPGVFSPLPPAELHPK